jgi:hypothetical protein
MLHLLAPLTTSNVVERLGGGDRPVLVRCGFPHQEAVYDPWVVGRVPRFLLHAEGAVVAVAAVALYFHLGYPWWLLVVLALAPDLSMLGYLAGPVAGSLAYDLAHTYAVPVALAVIGVLAGADVPVQVALIWVTHIGIDRAIGYGLKYPSGFEDTHLQRV